MLRFALDQNFPAPVVEGLKGYLIEAELVSVVHVSEFRLQLLELGCFARDVVVKRLYTSMDCVGVVRDKISQITFVCFCVKKRAIVARRISQNDLRDRHELVQRRWGGAVAR